jgi:hypothetical protein
MSKTDEHILKAAKEVIVKYIEVGRVSPGTFAENFKKVYEGIYNTVHSIDYKAKEENVAEED